MSTQPPEHIQSRDDGRPDPEALLNILHSIRRMGLGFTLALAFAIPVGLTMGRSWLVAAFFNCQAPEEFQLPTGLFINHDDRIYVVDSYNRRVQVLRYIGQQAQGRGL